MCFDPWSWVSNRIAPFILENNVLNAPKKIVDVVSLPLRSSTGMPLSAPTNYIETWDTFGARRGDIYAHQLNFLVQHLVVWCRSKVVGVDHA